tara:strand:+ start:156 stop:503 length:348 start_codon:yes stop_codon:yes gene_type:complete
MFILNMFSTLSRSTPRLCVVSSSSYFESKKCKRSAQKVHRRLKAFEQRKRDANLKYFRDLSETLQHDLKELDAIAKSLMDDHEVDFHVPEIVVPGDKDGIEFEPDDEDDEFFEPV